MRPAALWFVYRKRLRAQLGEELLAVFGVAVGVALVFAVLVANQSLSGSVGNSVRGIVGDARYELRARDARGFGTGVLARVERVPSVRLAAPATVRRIRVVGPRGTRSVTLLGGSGRLQRLGGTLVQRVGPVGAPAISLPDSVARPVGLHPGQRMTIVAGHRRVRAHVGAILGAPDIGRLARSPIVIAPLPYAQRLTGSRGRITHVLVQPKAGRDAEARRALERIAAGRLDVRPADAEASLMREAARSNDQSSLLFSAISAAVGLLFAYNAMLLTLPTRRRTYAEMRLLGYRRRQVLTSLVFETGLLALAGVVMGLLLGELLSRLLFGGIPRYLASAFPVGADRIVSAETVAIACAVGVVGAFAVAARPLRELYGVNPMDATHRLAVSQGEGSAPRHPARYFLGGLALLGALTVLTLAVPSASLVAATSCALVAVAMLPLALRALGRGVERASAGGPARALAWIAVKEVQATPTRGVALAATAAVAVFGITTVEGARHDLIRGADRFAAELGAAGDVHVVAGGPENYLALEPFASGGPLRRIRGLRGVRSVAVHRGQLLDVGRRRLALFGRPPRERQLAMAGALVDGSPREVAARLRGRGWAALSSAVARERGLSVGERTALPTPRGEAAFRVAGITTNYFWPPGAVVVGARDYGRLWGRGEASELMVDLDDGVTASEGRRRVAAALGPASGLRVLTARERTDEFGETARQALTTLGQIAALVLVCASLAVGSAMAVAVWQRRQRLAALKAIGFSRGQLLRLIALEAAMLLTVGGALGGLLGLYAQAIASRWVEVASGSSVSYAPALGLALTTLAALVLLATAAAAVPGRLAAAVSPRAAFSE